MHRIVPVLVAAALGAARPRAQSYPDRPIRLVVPAAPGGPTDIPARLLSQILPQLGQPVVVENRPGAGGAIGARAVASAVPDGYTLLVGNTSVLAVIPAVSPSAGYDPAKSFAPVAKISESYQILVVHPSAPWKSVQEFVADAKANPGQVQPGAYRRRRPAASDRRAVQGEHRRRSGRRGVQERRRSRHRAARPAGACHVRGDLDPAAADPRRQGARARHHQPRAHAARERHPDHDRGRRAGLRGLDLLRRGRAGRHAARHHREAQRRDQPRLRRRGHARRDQQARQHAALGSADAFAAFMAAQTAKWHEVAKKANIKVE